VLKRELAFLTFTGVRMTIHRLDENADGVFIISATPFTYNGSLDFESNW